MDKCKIYSIESKHNFYGYMFRFYSLYNGARGSWCYHKEEAIQEGKQHQKIIKSLIKTGEIK